MPQKKTVIPTNYPFIARINNCSFCKTFLHWLRYFSLFKFLFFCFNFERVLDETQKSRKTRHNETFRFIYLCANCICEIDNNEWYERINCSVHCVDIFIECFFAYSFDESTIKEYSISAMRLKHSRSMNDYLRRWLLLVVVSAVLCATLAIFFRRGVISQRNSSMTTDPASNANFNQARIEHFSLKWNVDFAAARINGIATLTIKFLEAIDQIVSFFSSLIRYFILFISLRSCLVYCFDEAFSGKLSSYLQQ